MWNNANCRDGKDALYYLHQVERVKISVTNWVRLISGILRINFIEPSVPDSEQYLLDNGVAT